MRIITRRVKKYELLKDTSVPYEKWYYVLKNPYNSNETILLYGFSKKDLTEKINKQRKEWYDEIDEIDGVAGA